MISNGPSRTFTQEAVLAWLGRLCSSEWEKFFSKKQLNQAQKFYREGYLSTVDIQENQAIITKKINREETYSVVEWNRKGPEIRTSLDDEETGIALATAGLYEIEELISELQADNPLLGHGLIEENIKEEPPSEVPDLVPPPEQDKHTQVIPLLIRIELSSQRGLRATPHWKINPSAVPVYSEKEAGRIESSDRPGLMRFVAEAGRKGFEFNKKKGGFSLSDWKDVAKFTEESLPVWEKSFELEFVGEAQLLRHGQRTLSWEIEARNRSEEDMNLRENFYLGNRRLGTQHIRRLTSAKEGSTFIRGYGLVRLDQDQIEDFDWWQRNRGDAKRASWPRYMLFSLFARKYLKTRADGQLEQWRKSIKDLHSDRGVTRKFSFLRPYQKQGVAQLHALHKLGCHPLLADEMGLGKTIQTLALLSSGKSQNLPDLVTCPASVVPVWVKEAAEHYPRLKVKVLCKEENFEDSEGPCLWVASYTQLRRHRQLLDRTNFRYAVLDEAQLIKNPKAKVTQACLSISAMHRLALSGTPIENSALDLWTIFRFLMPGLLGARKELEKNLVEDAPKTLLLLRRQVTPFVLRRMKNEVASELPPKLETELPCPLNEEQRKAYKELAQSGMSNHGNDLREAIQQSSIHIFSLLTRLRQACCDLSLLPGYENQPSCGSKSDMLIEKLFDLSSSGSKVLVFSQFTRFLSVLKKRIKSALPDLEVLELTGSTRDRSKPVDHFEASEKPIVLLASLKAAGLGVTLKSADYVFLMDPWWNPAIEEQAIDRAHRLGREKPTFIYRMVAQGTIEERVRQLQLEKKETFRQVIGNLDQSNGLTDHFSTLEELIQLNE